MSTTFSRLAGPTASLSAADFSRAAELLKQRSGILLGSHKHEGVARALGQQATRLNLDGPADYLDYLQSHPQDDEWHVFINAFTVNHTAFFRENHHFLILADFLRERSVPLDIWTCAASTGEEAYSIAITLDETFGAASTNAHILATDIDTAAIKRARAGVYAFERVEALSEERLKRYFLRGTGNREGQVRVKPFLQKMVQFGVLNLLDTVWPIEQQFDAIFCRNTLIYFDRPTQITVLERLAKMLKEGGLLFVGHSENFTYHTQQLRLRGQTVYEKAG